MPIEIESPEQMGYGNIECNLTESSFSDAVLGNLDLSLNHLVLCYGDHMGKPELRELIAADIGLAADDVMVTAGAATALFILSTSLLKSGDHLVVEKPNYATNIETPRAIGAFVHFLEMRFENEFRVDIDELENMITPDTKYVSVTCPHNPTGTMLQKDELHKLIELIESRRTILLLDETYRDMAFEEKLPSAASLSSKVISVSSLSKTYGLPGIRIGWLACRDRTLMEMFLAAKEQIMICNSVVDEEIAFRFLEKKKESLPQIKDKIQKHFGILKKWIGAENNLEWIEPSGGVVCFPRIKPDCSVDVEHFYKILNEQFKTFVGPGHWFEMDRRYMRIGYGWPDTDELQRGLNNISKALRSAVG